MGFNVDDLMESYESMTKETPSIKKVSIKDFITPAEHGKMGSSYCNNYCRECIRNGATYVTRNSPIREFFVALPLVGEFVTDYGFQLSQKALPLFSGGKNIKESVKLLTEKPVAQQLEELREKIVEDRKKMYTRIWRDINER